MKFISRIFVLLSLCLGVSGICSQTAFAHQLSTAYMTIAPDNDDDTQLIGQIQVRWMDLELAVGIDSNLDGDLKWEEVQARSSAIIQYLTQHLRFKTEQAACILLFNDQLKTDQHIDEGYMVADFIVTCPASVKSNAFSIMYDGLFEVDAAHKLLLNFEGFDNRSTLSSSVFEKSVTELSFDQQKSAYWRTFKTYVYQGVVHIFIGIDHILFLVALLLTCVLYRDQKKWQPIPSMSRIVKDTAWMITAFTLAHSITLTATALGWIAPSSRWVEFGIALSVFLTAINNVWPLVLRLGWLSFGFGLLHGMGFASVLGELGLSSQHMIWSVIAFNLGVELGQLAILAVLLPVLAFLRKNKYYPTLGVTLGSFVIGIIALNWSIQRF